MKYNKGLFALIPFLNTYPIWSQIVIFLCLIIIVGLLIFTPRTVLPTEESKIEDSKKNTEQQIDTLTEQGTITTTGNNSPAIGKIEVQPGGIGVQTVINNITKVEKEIANTEESVEARYASLKNMTLHKSDIDTKIISVKNKDASIILLVILLDDVPMQNSIRISTDKGDISPSQINQVLNLIFIRMDLDVKWFFTYYTNSCNIQYVPKTNVKHPLVKFTDVELFINDSNIFKIKPLTEELKGIMAHEFQDKK